MFSVIKNESYLCFLNNFVAITTYMEVVPFILSDYNYYGI